MCHVKTEIMINASPEIIWHHLTDFKAYPQWNPFLVRVEERDQGNLEVDMKSGKSTMTFRPRITKSVHREEFRWVGKLGGVPGIFTGEHYFQLLPEGSSVRLVHGEHFTGILAILLWPFMKKEIEANFQQMNNALKELSEQKEI